jgi:enoyl-CoA hydratase
MPIPITFDAGVAVLALELGRGNAIDHAFIEAIHAALDAVLQSDARAAVITGKGRVFCGGLDLVAIHGYDRLALGRFVDAFEGMFRRLYAFERPLVAAINGHALAGGAILAMACDLRVMADGPSWIGVNEVQLGIPFPAAAFEIVRQATPGAARRAVMLQGKRLSQVEARAAGIVQRLAGERGVVADAIEEARLFAAGGAEAVRAVKADLTAPVLAKIDATSAARRERFLDAWFGAEAQARVTALRDGLAAKQKPVG